MKVKDVFIEYHKIVPFPWTPRKIKKAGFSPTELAIEIGKKIQQCEDADTPAGVELLDTIAALDMLGG